MMWKMLGMLDENMKKTAAAESMRENIGELMKAQKEMMAQALQIKMKLAEKKQQDKMTKWQQETSQIGWLRRSA